MLNRWCRRARNLCFLSEGALSSDLAQWAQGKVGSEEGGSIAGKAISTPCSMAPPFPAPALQVLWGTSSSSEAHACPFRPDRPLAGSEVAREEGWASAGQASYVSLQTVLGEPVFCSFAGVLWGKQFCDQRGGSSKRQEAGVSCGIFSL